MNKTDFCERFAKEAGVKKGVANEMCAAVFDLLAVCIKENDKVYIRGLGTFKKITKKAHRIGDIRNGGSIEIPATEKVVFKMTDNFGLNEDDAE